MNQAGPGAHLLANLNALAKVAPGLVKRISLPVGTHHVGVDAAGAWHAQWGDRWFPLALTPEARTKTLGSLSPKTACAAVLGLGEPQMVLDLLRQHPHCVVYAWDRDPWILRLFLGAADMTDALRAGRLRLLLGVDVFQAQAALHGCEAVVHPTLGAFYEHERRSLAAPDTVPLAFVARGGLFVDDVAEALWQQGFRVYTLDLHNCAAEELVYAVKTARPRLLAAINYTEGLAAFCEQLGLPLMCWEIDPSTSAVPPCPTPPRNAFIFTYREAHVQAFRNAGFPNVAYLPLAANPTRRSPMQLDQAERDRFGGQRPTYVGTSIAQQIPSCEAAFAAAVHDVTPPARAQVWLQQALAAQAAAGNQPVLQSALEAQHPGLGARVAALTAAAEIAAAHKRLRYVAGLGDLGMWVWGDEGWRHMDAFTPGHQAQYRGSASHKLEITKIYNASAVNVDIGRLYQNDIVTMRVFDIAACGGFVLAEHSAALAQIFELGHNMDSHNCFEELRDKTRHHLAHPAAAQAMAARARDVVMADHTIAGRVAHMLGRIFA